MRLRWHRTATQNLIDAAEYIAQDNPLAASKVVDIITTLSRRLADYPLLGRPGRITGTREFAVPRTSYILVYRIRNARVEIMRIFHGARKWPAQFDE